MLPNEAMMKKVTEDIYEARREQIICEEMDVEYTRVEVWDVTCEALVEMFGEPEFLFPIIHKFLSDQRHDIANRVNSFAGNANAVMASLKEMDEKRQRWRTCIEYVTAIRRREKDRDTMPSSAGKDLG